MATLLVDPSKCKVDGPGLNNAEVNQQTHIIVTTMLPSGAPTEEPLKVTAELKSLVDESVVQLEGVQKQGNTYEIQFSSAVRGRHQLTVNVNDQPITGSPFPVFVKMPPTQLGKPVRVIDVEGPCDVTVNSAGEILVTESGKRIAVFDKKGKKLNVFKMPTDELNLTGIATDEDGNMYMTDDRGYTLIKLNKDGEVVKRFGKHGKGNDEFSDPSDVVVIGDEVYVCDKLNDRVQVYTKDTLEYVKTIGSYGQGDEEFSWAHSLAHDKDGNMFVTDTGNNRVKMLNKQGKCQLTFGTKTDGQSVNGPTGVCVFDEFVYVVEYMNFCISVFTKAGQFVTSFGKQGTEEGEINFSFGLCADCDGFLYICDNWNNRVQVF